MFGHNEIVGRKFFRERPEARVGKLLVTSVFNTIQGEGPLAGVPAVFVRLAMCQLRCEFCDTYFDSGDWLSFDDLLDRMAVVRGSSELLVVTGGEPALQENLASFLDYVPGASSFTQSQVETNGLLPIPVSRVIGASHRVTVVASPKAVRGEYQRLPGQSLERADCLKFVVSGDPASAHHTIPDWALSWRADTGREIFISPMAEYRHLPEQSRSLYDSRRAPGMDARSAAERISFWEPGLLDLEKCRRNHEHAADYVLEHGLRLTMQMQLFASMP